MGADVEVVEGIGPEDAPGLKTLFESARAHDDHAPIGEHKRLDLLHGTSFAGVIAGSRDAPVGYAHVSRHGRRGWGIEVVVAPEHRDGDVQRALLERAVSLVAGAGGGHVHWWVFKPTEACDAVAEALGFRRGRDLLYVCVDLPIGQGADLPAGVSLRAFEPGRDEEAWLDVNNRAFADHPEQGEWDAGTLDRRMREAWFDPQDFLIADDGSGIAGFNWTKLDTNTKVGEIYVIGVDPDRQGGKLGKALVLAGLEHMHQRGMRRCGLYVDSANEPALGMYRRIGFEVDHVDRAYVKDEPPR